MEDNKQHIQDAMSNYLAKNPAPNINILNNADDTINYIKELLQLHHSYPEPPNIPIIKFYSTTT